MHQFLKLPVTFYDNYGYCKLVKIKVQIRVINSDPKSVNYLYNDFRHFIEGEMRRILASQSLPPTPPNPWSAQILKSDISYSDTERWQVSLWQTVYCSQDRERTSYCGQQILTMEPQQDRFNIRILVTEKY